MSQLMLRKVVQHFPRPRLDDVAESVLAELNQHNDLVKTGDGIAIAVGSRGVANIQRVVKTVVQWVKTRGGNPFIIPAMGSHGGGTASGQTAVLASYGVTEAETDAPVRSTMETVDLTPPGFPHGVYMDRYAYESDGVILINRIKVHTDFHGLYESGLVKLSVIGLGKHRQALEIHSYGVYGLRERIPETAEIILSSGKIKLGLGLVENAYDETMRVQALSADQIMVKEPELLEISRQNMPRLPVDCLDVLLIDRVGKDISGTCIDPNIVGRIKIRGEVEPERPDIKAIVAADITPASHGNVVGIGFADVITRCALQKIDFDATYENTVTSSFLERGKLPVVAPDDATAYAWALRSCGKAVHHEPKVVRILDTLHLSEIFASSRVIADLQGKDNIEIIGDYVPMFDDEGNLKPFK